MARIEFNARLQGVSEVKSSRQGHEYVTLRLEENNGHTDWATGQWVEGGHSHYFVDCYDPAVVQESKDWAVQRRSGAGPERALGDRIHVKGFLTHQSRQLEDGSWKNDLRIIPSPRGGVENLTLIEAADRERDANRGQARTAMAHITSHAKRPAQTVSPEKVRGQRLDDLGPEPEGWGPGL